MAELGDVWKPFCTLEQTINQIVDFNGHAAEIIAFKLNSKVGVRRYILPTTIER
jgi:hypothetical protein